MAQLGLVRVEDWISGNFLKEGTCTNRVIGIGLIGCKECSYLRGLLALIAESYCDGQVYFGWLEVTSVLEMSLVKVANFPTLLGFKDSVPKFGYEGFDLTQGAEYLASKVNSAVQALSESDLSNSYSGLS
jgi:hypothetical protein